ncbi:hypothetical protein DNTS_027664 [Danionella cerebrum]|uniref:Uncharacterized protein n=1 Tax=Danionella cerebrum TaxID=2873325 RepID=A0A553NH98_9TELE|nr:hypothetical protein DNTS_027664 [Danionella translucida]
MNRRTPSSVPSSASWLFPVPHWTGFLCGCHTYTSLVAPGEIKNKIVPQEESGLRPEVELDLL